MSRKWLSPPRHIGARDSVSHPDTSCEPRSSTRYAIDRKSFLTRYPNVESADVDRLLAATRRWRIIGIGALVMVVLLLSATAFATLRIHHVATDDAPRIANEMATERYGGIQRRVNERTAEARELVGDFFVFMGDLLEQNPTLKRLEREWRTASDNANLLTSDLAALTETPVASSKELWKYGRERVEAIIASAARMIMAIHHFVPNAVASLDTAHSTLQAKTTFGEAVDLVELLVVPLMEDELELVQRWSILRSRILAWKSLVEDDVDAVRESMRGEVVTEEFFERISQVIW